MDYTNKDGWLSVSFCNVMLWWLFGLCGLSISSLARVHRNDAAHQRLWGSSSGYPLFAQAKAENNDAKYQKESARTKQAVGVEGTNEKQNCTFSRFFFHFMLPMETKSPSPHLFLARKSIELFLYLLSGYIAEHLLSLWFVLHNTTMKIKKCCDLKRCTAFLW